MVVDTLSYHCPPFQCPCPTLPDTNRGASGVAKLSCKAIAVPKASLWRTQRSLLSNSRYSRANMLPERQVRMHATGDFDTNKKFDAGSQEEIEAVIEAAAHTNSGPAIFLRLLDGSDIIFPIFVGEFEFNSLVTALKSASLPRPGVYDMMKSTLDSLDFIVSRVRVTNLRNNAFIARVHYCQKASSVKEFDVDSRPSDAINLACRFNVPIYVNKTVALATAVQIDPSQLHTGAKLNQRMELAFPRENQARQGGTTTKLHKPARASLPAHGLPMLMELSVQQSLASLRGNYEDASKIRSKIQVLLNVPMRDLLEDELRQAIMDQNFELAAYLRDELKKTT